MASLESRISKLESHAPDADLVRLSVEALPPLGSDGELAWDEADPWHRDYRAKLMELGSRSSSASIRDPRLSAPIDIGLAVLLFDPHFARYPLALEQYRDRVPGRVIASVYNAMRNYGFAPILRLRVRQLAGVIDETGSVLPGYALLDNGCIVDAPAGDAVKVSMLEGRA